MSSARPHPTGMPSGGPDSEVGLGLEVLRLGVALQDDRSAAHGAVDLLAGLLVARQGDVRFADGAFDFVARHGRRIGERGRWLERGRRRGAGASAALAAALTVALACAGARDDAAADATRAADRNLDGFEVHLATRGLDAGAAGRALEAGLAEASRLAAMLLAEREASEIDVLNHVPMQVAIALSPETLAAVSTALEVAEETDGAYDPTARAPLEHVWGLDAAAPHRPRDFEITAALRRVDWTDVEVDPEAGTASLLSRHTRLDLGPVAVGAILDGAALAAVRAGAPGALASARGVWVASGGAVRPWSIRLPVGDAGGGDALLLLSEGAAALARAGPTVHTDDGGTLRLPLDPRSGQPAVGADWALARCARGARAGGVAAALLVLGTDAPAWIGSEPDTEGALQLRGGGRFASPGSGVVFEEDR